MILITGSTGHIGSEVVRLLSQAGVPARALARNPDKGQKLPGVTWMAGDLAKPETLPTRSKVARSCFCSPATLKTRPSCNTMPL